MRIVVAVLAENPSKLFLVAFLVEVSIKLFSVLNVLTPSTLLSHLSWETLIFKSHIKSLVAEVVSQVAVVLITSTRPCSLNTVWRSIHLNRISLAVILTSNVHFRILGVLLQNLIIILIATVFLYYFRIFY